MGVSTSVEFANFAIKSKEEDKQESERKAIAFYQSNNALFHSTASTPQEETDLQKEEPTAFPIDISFQFSRKSYPTTPFAEILKNFPDGDKLLREVLSPTSFPKLRKIQLDAIFERNITIDVTPDHQRNVCGLELLLGRECFVKQKPYKVASRVKILLECAGRDDEGHKRLRETASNRNFNSLSRSIFDLHPFDLDLFRLLIIDYDGYFQNDQILGSIVYPLDDINFQKSCRNPQFDKVRSEMLREFISSGKMTEEMRLGVPSPLGTTPLMTAARLGLVECVKELVANRVGGVVGWEKFRIAPKFRSFEERLRFEELKEKDYNKWFASTYSVIHLACCSDFSLGNSLIKEHTLRDQPQVVEQFRKRTAEIVQILMSLPGMKEEALRSVESDGAGLRCHALAVANMNLEVVQVLESNGIVE